MYSIVSTAIIQGIRSIPVFVEADVSDGMPLFEMVGFLASEVKESRERVRTALRNSGYVLPPKRITVNFTPANIRKSGSGFDLPMAVAVLAALGIIPNEELREVFIIGEIGLNGKVQPVSGILPMVAEAKERGLAKCIVPLENRQEAMMVSDIEICGADCLKTVIGILKKEAFSVDQNPYNIEEKGSIREMSEGGQIDFADIHGQKMVKRACEVAVSGMHNLLMIGPPGAGKTMVAMRLATILPPLDEQEQMELSKVYSVCGLFGQRQKLMQERPFRAPHHTITMQGLAGGGNTPKPGEISLAHKGVLFLDELPEFQPNTLEILRQPMEEKSIRLIRLNGSYEYPADFILVAAMNPCRCGYYPDMQKCRCTSASIGRYISRISQPLLDRMDVCVETPKMKFEDLTERSKEETSADIRKRVLKTQEIQKGRYKHEPFQFNSQVPAARIQEFCCIDKAQETYMGQMYQKLNLTARSYHKILKVARTLADMEASEKIENRHLSEAICYRSLDRKFWGQTM